MADDNARQKLLHYLDRHAFDPVDDVSPDRYRDEHMEKCLRDAQATIRSTRYRCHHSYDSAQSVVLNFHRDLDSAELCHYVPYGSILRL